MVMEKVSIAMKAEMIEGAIIIGGLVCMQFVYAGNSVLLSYLMSLGIRPLTLVISFSFATFLVLTPIALCFERSRWPRKFSIRLLLQLILMSFAGVTLVQSLCLKGIELTSAAMATAMPNLAPGLIFVIAWIFGLEKVNIRCKYSKVKLMGTLLCVVGAITMSIMHSLGADAGDLEKSLSTGITFDKQKVIGCIYLLVGVIVLSSNVVLHAVTLGEFPAPISMCAITSIIGVFITAVVQIIQDPTLETLWPNVALRDLVLYSLLVGSVSGVCVSFNGWAIKKRGPVLVSMFCPIGTVCTVILSVITLGESIKLGSLAGMSLMFTGLYFALWAKGKEKYSKADGSESEYDIEKPLLS